MSPLSSICTSFPGGPPLCSNTATLLTPAIGGIARLHALRISGVRTVRFSDVVSCSVMDARLSLTLRPALPYVENEASTSFSLPPVSFFSAFPRAL